MRLYNEVSEELKKEYENISDNYINFKLWETKVVVLYGLREFLLVLGIRFDTIYVPDVIFNFYLESK